MQRLGLLCLAHLVLLGLGIATRYLNNLVALSLGLRIFLLVIFEALVRLVTLEILGLGFRLLFETLVYWQLLRFR